MLGTIFIGLSGMSAFSNGLRQISNNITNINSTGYKASNLQFADLVGSGDAGPGHSQGVELGTPRIDFGQGELRQSDRDLDIAIDGQGFLVLSKGSDLFYARTGSFEVDDEGYIRLAGKDYRLTIIGDGGEPVAANIDALRMHPPARTTRIRFDDNISTTAETATVANIAVFNESGASANWTVKFTKVANASGEWTVAVTNGDGASVGTNQTLKFIGSVANPTTSRMTFADTDGRSVEFDFSSVDSFSSGTVSTIRAAEVDGFGTGEITAVRVSEEGFLEIAYNNEQIKKLGAVSIAMFRDPQSLSQRSEGIFASAGAAGREFLTSAHATTGRAMSRRIEASNVDLSREFGDLILVQRGYQASSQVVSVSNDMIQQLFGIRGQG
jgi:flagellar hook protein FlgE